MIDYTGFGLNEKDMRVSFNEKTGEFSITGKVEIGSYAYNMLKETFYLQTLDDKLNTGDITEEDVNYLLKMISELLPLVKDQEKNKKHEEEKKINSCGAFRLTPKEAFFMKEIDVLDSIPLIKNAKSKGKKIHIYKDPISISSLDPREVAFTFSHNIEALERMDIRKSFLYHSALYYAMFQEMEDEEVFRSAAKCLDCRDIRIMDIFDDIFHYRIILEDKDGEVHIIYVK